MVAVGCILAFVSVVKVGQMAGNPGYPPAADCPGVLMAALDVLGPAEELPTLSHVDSNIAWYVQRAGIPGLVLSSLAFLAAAVPSEKATTEIWVASDPEQSLIHMPKEAAGTWAHLRWAASVFSSVLVLVLPAVAIFTAVSAEQYLLGREPRIPSLENMTSVGQWGGWVATGVVVLAAAMNAVKGRMSQSNPRATAEHSSPSV